MVDEHRLLRDATKAAQAETLLGNELLTEAFKTLEATYFQWWRNTDINDITSREKLFLAINVVGKVKDHLATVVMNGKLAAAELKALADNDARKKRFA